MKSINIILLILLLCLVAGCTNTNNTYHEDAVPEEIELKELLNENEAENNDSNSMKAPIEVVEEAKIDEPLEETEISKEEPNEDLKSNKFLKELPENAVANITLRNMNGLGSIKFGHYDKNNNYVFDILYTFDEYLTVKNPGIDRDTSFWEASDDGIDPISLMNYGRARILDEKNGYYKYYGLMDKNGKLLIPRIYQDMKFKRNNKFGIIKAETYNGIPSTTGLYDGGYVIDENGNIIKQLKIETVCSIHGKVVDIDGEITTFGDVNEEIKNKLENGYKLIDYNNYFLDYYVCYSENDPIAYVVDMDLKVVGTINREDYFTKDNKIAVIDGEEYFELKIDHNYGEEIKSVYGHKIFSNKYTGKMIITDEKNNILLDPENEITRIYYVIDGQRYYKIQTVKTTDKDRIYTDYILDLKELKILTYNEFTNILLNQLGLAIEGTEDLTENYKMIKEDNIIIEEVIQQAS